MTTPFGYTGKVLWIDLTHQTSHLETRDDIWWRRHAGGGLAATALLLERTSPGIDPLSADSLLIFASSVIAGHRAPGLARFTTAAKSPLTNGIGETRTEGPWGIALKECGADILVFAGRAEYPVTVAIARGQVSFHPAGDLWGSVVGDTVDRLEAQFGPDCHVAAIGPAGENLVRFASIVTDRTYQASRMGMGAVMGAKQLKAVVILPGDPPAVHDPATLQRIAATFAERIPGNDLSRWQYDPPGFSCWIYLHGVDAALDVNNYSQSTFRGIAAYQEQQFLARPIAELGCPGCPNRCIKAIHPLQSPDLDPRASGIHQEITGAMGLNLGIGDLDAVLRANNLCSQFGLDPTSLGFTISFAMELFARGILGPQDNGGATLHFGDATAALSMLEQITYRRGLGDLLAEGSRRAAQAIGPAALPYAMQVKGLELVPFEPRSQTNLALGYAAAPIGPRYDICEHDWDFDTRVGWEHTLRLSRTLGILERSPMDYLGPDKVRNFVELFNLWSAADALGFCIFAVAPTRLLSLEDMAAMLAAVTGWETSSYEVMRFGARRNHIMRWYNHREGLTSDDDWLPDRFYTEPIAAGPRQGDVLNRHAFGEALAVLYAMMGWNQTGVPTPATLFAAGLDWLLSSSVPQI